MTILLAYAVGEKLEDNASGNARDRIRALRLSRRLHVVITENVSFAIGVKLLVMALGTIGVATLWAAVFADTGIPLLVIILTLFALRPRETEEKNRLPQE